MTQRRTIIAVACLGMLSFGIVLTTLGAMLPTVIHRFGLDKAQAGALFLLLSFGIMAGSLVFGPIADRRGYKSMLLLSLAAIAIAILIIAFALSLAWLRIAIALIGFGGGVVNGGSNALVADVSSESRGAALSLVGAFFGVGAAGVPFALSVLGGTFGQSGILAVISAIVMVPFVIAVLTTFPPPKQPHGFPIAHARGLLKDSVLLLMGLMLFLESGIEITVGGWTSTLFAEDLGVPAERALVYLSLYWLGMTTVRLGLGQGMKKASGTQVLLVGITIALLGALLVVTTHSVSAAATGVFLLGCGFAPTFPVVLGFVGDRYVQLSGTAFSLVIVMALVGGMLLPYATGVLGGWYGLRGSFLIVPAALVLLAVLVIIVSRRLGMVPRAAPAV